MSFSANKTACKIGPNQLFERFRRECFAALRMWERVSEENGCSPRGSGADLAEGGGLDMFVVEGQTCSQSRTRPVRAWAPVKRDSISAAAQRIRFLGIG